MRTLLKDRSKCQRTQYELGGSFKHFPFFLMSGNDSIGLLFFQMGRWFNHQFSEHPPDCAHVRSSIIASKGITTTCLGPEPEKSR